MASARNLCQHSDIDGSQCTSNDYISCPHCQLQLCLKHLNYHQDLLRSDVFQLADRVDELRCTLDNVMFDSNNHRQELCRTLDSWYQKRRSALDKLYWDKKHELHDLCSQAYAEFQTCKAKKNKELKENLIRQLRKVLKQKQIHIDDLNEMRNKLTDIERGLDELRQLLIDVHRDDSSMNIQIVKRRYVEAAKPSFSIDDDDHLWDIDDADDDDEQIQPPSNIDTPKPISASTHTSSSPKASPPPLPPPPSTTVMKKEPLKFIIKRLQLRTRSTKVSYRLHTVTTSAALRT